MSLRHEARPSVTNQSNHELPTETLPGAPEQPEKKSRRNLLIGIGSGAAALALAGGIFAGVGNGGEKTEPKHEPVASAPATPGQTEAPTPAETPATPATETSPTAAAPKPEKVGTDFIINEFTTDTFPFVHDGQQMTQEQLISSVSVSAEKYPTFQEAMPVIVDEINSWIASGATKEENTAYNTGKGENGIYLTADQERAGTDGIARDFYNPAYSEALTTGTDQAFSDYISKLHGQTLGYYNHTVNDATPYEAHFTMGDYVTSLQTETQATVWVKMTLTDNGDKNSIGDLRAEEGGLNGITTPTINDTSTWHFELVQRDGNWLIDTVNTNAAQ